MLSLDKQNLRIRYKEILNNNLEKIKAVKTHTIVVNRLNELIDSLKVTKIGIYYPTKYEINILSLIESRSDLEFSLPKIEQQKLIYLSYSLGDSLSKNSLRIYEPESNNNKVEPELICIPGLAFDIDCYRLGYGFGYFDYYLKDHKKLFSVGICISEQIVKSLPIEHFDQNVDKLIIVA